MNSSDIYKILSRDVYTARYFRGVFPADKIPALTASSGLVANTEGHMDVGSHWIAMFVHHPQTLEFFDSYGLPPSAYGQDIENFARQFTYVKCNKKQLQSLTSNVCGHYCIYYLVKRCQGQSMDCIVRNLSVTTHNDFQIFQFVKRRYNVKMIFKK